MAEGWTIPLFYSRATPSEAVRSILWWFSVVSIEFHRPTNPLSPRADGSTRYFRLYKSWSAWEEDQDHPKVVLSLSLSFLPLSLPRFLDLVRFTGFPSIWPWIRRGASAVTLGWTLLDSDFVLSTVWQVQLGFSHGFTCFVCVFCSFTGFRWVEPDCKSIFRVAPAMRLCDKEIPHVWVKNTSTQLSGINRFWFIFWPSFLLILMNSKKKMPKNQWMLGISESH